MRIVKLERVVLQNSCLFVYDQSQKSLSTTFDNYFHKTANHNDLEILLIIHRPKKVLSAGSLYGHLVPSPQSKCPKRTF